MGTRIYKGQLSGASITYTLKISDPSADFTRIAIKVSDPTRAVASGKTKTAWSSDGGETWTDSAGWTSPTDLISLRFFSGNQVYAVGRNMVQRSTDNGQTWANVTAAGWTGMNVRDVIEVGGTVYALVSNVTANAGGKIYAHGSGTTWTEHVNMLTAPWITGNEAPRRFVLVPGETNKVYLLTSHRLLLIEDFDGTPTSSPLINYWTSLASEGVTGVTERGYAAFDSDGLLDEILVEDDRIWLSGFNGLRLRSFDAGATWAWDTSYAASGIGQGRYSEVLGPSGVLLLTGSANPGTPGPRTGIWRSNNYGVSLNQVQSWPADHFSFHSASSYPANEAGCTDDDACNSATGQTHDDRSCAYATLLTHCSTEEVIHSSSLEIATLACRGPRFELNVGSVQGPGGPRSLTILLNGSQVLQFTWVNVNLLLTPAEQLELFLQQFVAYVNNDTTFTARFIPPSFNTLSPGGVGGVYIGCTGCGGSSITVVPVGLFNVTSSASVDHGSTGQIVELAERPGECWRVCGDGNCLLAAEYTITAIYPDCTRCSPAPPLGACFDCSTTVARSNGEFLIPTDQNRDLQCVIAGENISIAIQAVFPSMTSEVFTPAEGPITCGGPVPVEITLTGDRLTAFPQGSTFGARNISLNQIVSYTVGSVTYDPNMDITTIITEETCLSNAAIDEVHSFYQCICGVQVVIEKVVGSTAESVGNYNFQCNDGAVINSFNWMVPSPDKFRITIRANGCGVVKECIYWLNACEIFQAVETDCHTFEFRIRRPSNAPVDPNRAFTVRVRDIESGTVLLDRMIPNRLIPFRIITPGDGIYMLDVLSGEEVVSSIELIDLCDIQACRKKLVLDIFCGKNDPCCTDCKQTEEMERARLEMTRISLLLGELERTIGLAQYQRNQPSTLQDNHNAKVAIIRAMRNMMDVCGICKNNNNGH